MTSTENDLNSRRVDRGGGWHNQGATWARSASRNASLPAYRSGGLGFRAYLPGRMKR